MATVHHGDQNLTDLPDGIRGWRYGLWRGQAVVLGYQGELTRETLPVPRG